MMNAKNLYRYFPYSSGRCGGGRDGPSTLYVWSLLVDCILSLSCVFDLTGVLSSFTPICMKIVLFILILII